MLRISEKVKLFLATVIPLILICVMIFAFAHLKVRIFYGERSDALNILNGIVQGLSTIVAIVFSIIIVVVQTTLGKHVTRAIRYVISNWINILMLCLYVYTIVCALCTMWIISYETWALWVDVTVTASVLCIGALLPFFLRMPRSLNPTLIMNQVKDEILDACNRKDFHLMSDKTNLLFSMIRKSIETGDVDYAFEGFRFVEEVVRLEDSREHEWMFFNLIQSFLDNLGMQSLEKNPNVTLRIFDVCTRIIEKTKSVPPIFANIANRIVQSVVEICREALPTRFARPLLLKGYYIIIDVYKGYILLDYYILTAMFLDQSLREILKHCKEVGILDGSGIDFPTNLVIMELLKNEKNDEALHVLTIIFDEIPASPFFQLSIIGLVKDSKAEGFDYFASKSLQMMKKKFAPFKIDVIYDPNFGEGRTEMSVKPDGSMLIKTGNEKQKEASLWIKQQMI